MEPIKINFKDCSLVDLDKKFNLVQVDTNIVMDEWMNSICKYEMTNFENELLTRLQGNLIYRVNDWNEKELIEHFIGPLFGLVNFNTRVYGMFSDRLLKAIIGEYELSGNPDAIVAKGRREPEIPYFCFHTFATLSTGSYKKENESKGDPAG
jgi:hypothetical protein